MRSVEWDLEHGGEIICESSDSSERATSGDRRMDFAEAAARRQLHEVVEPITVCVRAETMASDARRLFLERSLRALPVVDEDLRLIGVVSRSDLLAAPANALARDIMPSRIHALPEHAPIGYAIALMGFEKISEVPVVTDDGEIVGLWHALDALRWTAERMGYVSTETQLGEEAQTDAKHHE
jgi:CBS domain-containing protein